MESSGEWFGEDFGQKIDLTVRIREILRNYPEGTSILKELVQNADDAGAREVRLCLDHRQHGTSELPSSSLAQFQGPALLVYNDGVFTETDFRSIQRIGDSLKKDTSKGGKTGRFGIGFNSVYHLTELPAFVSAGKWCTFDPQAKFLPNVNPANPGKMVDFLQHPETVRRYPDQFSPLNAFGCDMRSKFQATLFRFPLRTAEQASSSRLSRQSHSVQNIQALLQAFAMESPGMLLFLKNVERMSVFEWHPGQDEPQQVHETYAHSPSAALRRSRAFALSVTPEHLAGGRSTNVDYAMTIISQPSQGSESAVRETWQVCNQLGGPRATAIASSEQSKHMRLVPWAGVAARLSTTAPPEATAEGDGTTDGKERPVPVRGAAYCFLPLPVVTGLPVHVNGYFELSSNRRDIWHGDDMAGDGKLRANWNKALVEELAASCYSRVLVEAKSVIAGEDAYEALWPTGHTAAGSMWRGLSDSLMQLVKPLPVLKTRAQLGRGWVAPQNCVVWAADGVGKDGSVSAAGLREKDERERDQRALAEVLLAEKVPLVEGSRELRALLLSSGCARESSTPAFVRSLLKKLAGRRLSSGVAAAGPNGAVSLRNGNPNARKNCLLLLRYCLSDISITSWRGGARGAGGGKSGDGPGGYGELSGLPLVPLADGSHGVFSSFAAVDASKLELLKGMGFTEALSRQALLKHRGELPAAVEWLSTVPSDDDAGGRLFILCTDEEARLLSGAGSSLVSEGALSAGGAGAKGSVRDDSTAGNTAESTGDEDDAAGDGDNGRVLRALRSASLQSALNVTSMRDELLPDLVGQTLPEEWRGGGSTTAFNWTPGRGSHPQLEWFRRLWGYLAATRPSAVRLLAESFPVVPTGEGVVCPLSLRSAVIEGGRLSKEVRSILIQAGCRTLLPGVFAGDADASATAISHYPPGLAKDGEGKNDKGILESKAEASALTDGQQLLAPPPPAPRELFEYVRPGSREGVLAALGTARRSAGKPLKHLMQKASARERDTLREFLAREPASEMSGIEVSVCKELPILPIHEDGLAAARALAQSAAKATKMKAKASSVRVPTNGSTSASAAPAESKYAAADAGPLYLLLESSSEFVGIGEGVGSGEGESVAPENSPSSPKWLVTDLLTPNFVNIKMEASSGPGGSRAAEAALAERLGAKLVGRAAFFVEHVFPMLRQLPDGLRDAAMVEALLAAPRFSQQHEQFRSALAELKFVPAGGDLLRPGSVFDPEVPELPALLPESRFPEGVFRLSDVIAALRPLGLKGALDWSGLVEAAASVETLLGGGENCNNGEGRGTEEAAAAASRGRALLTYLDTHETRLFDLKRESGGLLQRLSQLVLTDAAAVAREKKRLAAIQHLMSLSWVPVLTDFPSPLVPATIENEQEQAGKASTPRGKSVVVVSPSKVRPREDMWISSRTFYVLDAEVRSSSVQEAFSWNTPIDPVVVARQVTGLAEVFSETREALDQGADVKESSTEQNARILEGHRQTMAGVVPRLYQLLSNAVEAHDARRQKGDATTNSASLATMEGVRAVLNDASWLWVGDAFVPADQVAFTSPANAAPYLYAVPPDLACFATLLRRFGVRSSFGPSDFCHALRRLALETGAAEPVVTPSSPSPGEATVGRVSSGRGVRGLLESTVAKSDGVDKGGDKKVKKVARQLTPSEVELAVAMVQVLSDESSRVSDLEVWVPDASSVLALSSDLLYDDAPWLTKQGLAPAAMSRGKPARFVHPKVSMAVGEKVGVGSLRRTMVSQNLARLDFDLKVPGESFGQQESLTRRLKHILQMYPEGPSILSELVQNADDAGARTVRVMLNTRQYGNGSLLSPAMSSWQGPSLYVFNDAIFTDRDFQNLARIGQASKLDKLSATGRFGLGFNSVYHFTDVPSFVSGEHLVMFDPHTKYVPGASSVQPGIKIRFAETNLLEQFPDQFSPYLFFGCELKNRFDGTLFRFPLRMADVAHDSEISHASYSPDSVVNLLNQFKDAANRYLLFLRHVQRIEVYTFKDEDLSPVLWYSVGVTKREPQDGWLTVPTFVSGHPRRPISKEAFYNKLRQTLDSALPKVDHLVTITFRQEAERAKGVGVGAGLGGMAAAALATSVTSASAVSHVPGGENSNDGDRVDVEGVGSSGSESELVEVGDEGAGGKAGTSAAREVAQGRRATSIVDVFLVCAAIGGGEAKVMACRPEGRAMKFIPWGGVAAHVSRNSQPPTTFEGQAFCFLPLPVTTRLPVHVNGFFELSTNRRDIWFGEDMAGAGKRRSEWNAILLRDVIAPIYASLVVKARDVMGPSPQHQALLPVADMAKSWENVVAATYANLKNAPVLFSRQSVRGEQGRWITPGKAVVVNEEDGGVEGEERVEYAKRLGKTLLWDGLPVVRLPEPLKKAMLHYDCIGADATPPFLRVHFKRTDIAHPCLGLDAGERHHAPSSGTSGRRVGLMASSARTAEGSDESNARVRPPAKQADARSNALFLLQAASAGLKADAFGELVGLPLLPLADGTLGRFGDPTERPVFLCSAAERRLLSGKGLGGEGGGAGHRILEDIDGLDQKTKELLMDKRVHAATNLAVMDPQDLAGMLDAVFPQAWKGLTQVAWAPGSRDVRPKQPSEDWLACLWDYMCTRNREDSSNKTSRGNRGGGGRAEHKDSAMKTIRVFERSWPLLPAMGGVGSDAIRVLLELHGHMPVVSPLAEGMRANPMSDEMKKVLSKLGVWVLDTDALRDQTQNSIILNYVNPCKPAGVLSALQHALFPNTLPSSALRTKQGDVIDPDAAAPEPSPSLDFTSRGRARQRIDNRFQSVDAAGRDSLRVFLSDRRSFGSVTEEQLELLRALPIYRVHGGGRFRGTGVDQRRRTSGTAPVTSAAATSGFTSISGSETVLLLAPKMTNSALLGPEFAVENGVRDTELLESLGVRRLGKGVFFREHVLPRAAKGNLPDVESRKAIISTLSNLQELCAEDEGLDMALREAVVVPDGGGELALISDLFDPAVDELQGLLAPEAFPAPEFRTPAALAGMRIVGLKNSLTCEGILQSARSIEAAFAPSASISSTDAEAAASNAADAEAREAAIRRSRKLLDFVDHRADQLLLSSGETGRWFVEQRANSREGQSLIESQVIVSSESNSDLDEDYEDNGDRDEARERRAEQRERKKEKRERQKARAEAMAAARPPPPNDFVEELASIVWLPVHAKAPNDLLPWKAQSTDARLQRAKVAAPWFTRPELDQWFCSLRLNILDGEVKSRSLKKAFGWDRPVSGMLLSVQLVALSKKFEKLTVLSQKAEMKRKLAVVTPDIYNNLDLLVGSKEFSQVRAALTDREWLWVRDKFVSSERIAFEVPSAAIPPLSAVPAELRSYSTLLTSLGVRKKFSAVDFIQVLRSVQRHFRARALDERNLDLAVGLVKTLAHLPHAERAKIQSEVVLVPDKNGPTLFPAASLVYDDAPWLSSRLKHMHLRIVHPTVSDEVAKAVGVRSLRECFLANQGGTQNLPCPIGREISVILNLSRESSDGGGRVEGANRSVKRKKQDGLGNRWLHDVMDVAETAKASSVDIILDENSYEQQSLLHPALADTQGPAVCVVLPHVNLSDKQLTKLLAPPSKPFGGDLSEGIGKPRIGNGVTALFELTDCLQVLSGNSLCLFDPCGEYLFTGEKQFEASQVQGSRDSETMNPAGGATGFTRVGVGNNNARVRRPSLSASSSLSPPPPMAVRNATPNPRHQPSSPSSSAMRGAGPRRTITGIGSASPSASRGLGGREDSKGPHRDPVGKRYSVRREDVFNQFPDQYSPFLALPGMTGQSIREGLTSGKGYSGTVFRMSLRTRPSEISGSKCSMEAVERELVRFAENSSTGLVMAYTLERVRALAMRRGVDGMEELFTSFCSFSDGRRKRREAIADLEWRKNGLNVFIRGFAAPRGKYKVTLRTSKRGLDGEEGSSGNGGKEEKTSAEGGKGGGGRGKVARLEKVEDEWMVSYVLAPPGARALALKGEFGGHNLTPLLTCASLVSRTVIADHREGFASEELPVVWGRLFVGQDTSVRTGLPFHVDGPFFVEKKGRKAFLVETGDGNGNGKPPRRFSGVAAADWNRELFGSLCTDLVPDHLVDLKNEFAGNDADSLYRFWPSAKRAKEPFSIMLPGQMLIGYRGNGCEQMYQRLGELPLYLSRSFEGGSFMTMKEGFFKTQAISPVVEDYIRRHVNLFSVPHTVTEDLARQPSVTVDKITPASVRQFLRRSKGDIARFAIANRPDAVGMGREQLADTDLLLELLEYCLSDCPPPGERPPGISSGRDGRSGGGTASAAAREGGGTVDAARARSRQAPSSAPMARAIHARRAAQVQAGEVRLAAEAAAAEATSKNDGGDATELNAHAKREQAMQDVAQWKNRLSRSKVMWGQLHGVPLLPLANGKAGSFGTSLASRGAQRFIVATRRQQGLIKQLSGRFVHLKAIRRLAKFFDCDEFLRIMGMERLTSSLLAENLHLVLPRSWKGEKFVCWRGGQSQANSGNNGGNDVPRAGWLALFWTEVSLLDIHDTPALEQWPLLPITTGELVSCSMLQQVVRSCPSMLNEVKRRGISMSLATVQRAEAAADERDQMELQDILVRQASEANPVLLEEDEEDLQELPEEEQEEEEEESEGTDEEQKEDGENRGRVEMAAGNNPLSVGDAIEPSSRGSGVGTAPADATRGAEDRSSRYNLGRRNASANVSASAAAVATAVPASSGPPPPPEAGNAPIRSGSPRVPAPAVEIAPPGPLPQAPPPQAAAHPPQVNISGVGVAARALLAGAMGMGSSPEAVQPFAAGAALPFMGPVPEPPRLKGLVSLLRRLGVPVLELAFFKQEDHSRLMVPDPNDAARGALLAIHALSKALKPQYPIAEACEARRLATGGEAGAVMRALIESGEDHARDSFGRKLRLRWGALESADMDALIQGLWKPSDSGTPVAFPASELDKLRDLPVWETLSGKRIKIVPARHFSLEEGDNIAGLPLPPSALDRLLAPSTQLSDLIRDMGVEKVNHPQVVARFILPELRTVPPEDRKRLLDHVREHWNTLKQERAVVDTLKQSAFVPVKGVSTRPSVLLDPRNEVLKEIFSDEPDAFPTGEFAEERWLNVLVDVGLRNKLDRETILKCAVKLASQRIEPLPEEVQNRAKMLMRHMNNEASGGELFNHDFLSKLSLISFVPAHLPPSFHHLDEDRVDRVPGDDDTDDGWSAGVVLVRFEEAAVPKDRNLVFTAFPVHLPGLVPSQLFWSRLKIQSPPPLEIVLRHIKHLTERHSHLDRWRYPQTPVKVFQDIFEYLEEKWSRLSPAVVKSLKNKPLVPVGARLIKPGRLFFRLKENLSPFMFEVPRAFGAFDSLFKNLGTTQSPTASDYAIFLKELATECGSQALNPNELGAVLKVLSLLAAEFEADTAAKLSMDIYVPDERSELVPWGLCLHNDSPSLAGRIDPSKLRCLHPRVSLEDCRRLRIASVSQVVREDLELGFEPEPFLGEEALQAQLSATLSSENMGYAVAVLVKQFPPEASAGVGSSSSGSSGGGDGMVTFEARANAAAARLKGLSVVFVKSLQSRFLRVNRRGGEEDITAPSGATGSLFFVREASKTILVARGELPGTFPPSYAVAIAVIRLIGLPSSAVGPLSVLLTTKPGGVEDCLGVLQVRQGALTGDEMTRGLPGEPLTARDKTLLELKPLKAFLHGEVIAWEDKSSPDSQGIMRYGIVIMGGDDEESPGDDRGSGRVAGGGGSGLRHVRVKLTPGRVDTLLSSQVYSFRQARAGGNQAPGLTIRAAQTLRHISRGESGSGKEGVEESKSHDGAGNAGIGAVSSAQLLDAVHDILGRADLSLTAEQGESLKQSLRHRDEAIVARAALAEAKAERDKLERKLKRVDKAFLCTICCNHDVDTILVPCGHMLCSTCMGSIKRHKRCPFCRVEWKATASFRRPGAEDVSDDEEGKN